MEPDLDVKSLKAKFDLSQRAMERLYSGDGQRWLSFIVGLVVSGLKYMVCPLFFICDLLAQALKWEDAGFAYYGSFIIWTSGLAFFDIGWSRTLMVWTIAAVVGATVYEISEFTEGQKPRQAVPQPKSGVPVLHNPVNEPLPGYLKGLGVEYDCYLQVDKTGFYAFAVFDGGETLSYTPSKIYYGFEQVSVDLVSPPFNHVMVYFMYYEAGFHRFRYSSIKPKNPARIALIAGPGIR